MDEAALSERIARSSPLAFAAILEQYRRACERGTPREALRRLGPPKLDYTDDLPALEADLDRAAMLHAQGELEEAWGLLLRAGEIIAYSLGRHDAPYEGTIDQLISKVAAERAPLAALGPNKRRDANHQRVVDELLATPASERHWKNYAHLDMALQKAFAKVLPDETFTDGRLKHLRAHPAVSAIRKQLIPLRRRRTFPSRSP